VATLNIQRLFPLLANLMRSRRIDAGAVVLNRKRIYILPTRRGLLFAVLLLAMLLGSINYGLSLGFVLTFLLAGLGLVGMLHTYRNLAGVQITAGGVTPVFAGEAAQFYLCLAAPGQRLALGLAWKKQAQQWVDLITPGPHCAPVNVPAPQRGWLSPGRFTLSTEFPLGLFHAWSYINFANRCVVYPAPLASHDLTLGESADQSGVLTTRVEGADDFTGLREYRPSDAPRHVAWKASTKSETLLTKQFATPGSTILWFDFDALTDPDIEVRLSRLTGMILQAEQSQLTYGLRLPDSEFAPDLGEKHRARCLQALALFGLPDA